MLTHTFLHTKKLMIINIIIRTKSQPETQVEAHMFQGKSIGKNEGATIRL